ncbi:DUF7342 family protein [Natronolimnobius baerhuensis]|uniref:Sugar-specific transcriptional regulator TrmB n=1 Tax=Natronolimnobius baerhuensis TaxID=253108 RepID=A0A202E984_9EURY|nr:hypothetical protein [Natronolimnobius baerhuensis]OVE84811.1 hypothetical protein B2G88_10560 [Natronolimnobius baerhuensis]
MEEPDPELQADADERESAPDFDALTDPQNLVRGERTRDDFFDAVLGLDSPATVGDIADLAGHGVDAAREYLDWFERMGIVTQVTESPATYERNDGYLRWRRVQQLQTQYTVDELLSALETERAADEEFAVTFGVDSPSDISITEYASATDQPVADAWEELSSWQTTRRRIDLLERALMADSGTSTDERTAV